MYNYSELNLLTLISPWESGGQKMDLNQDRQLFSGAHGVSTLRY